MIRSILTYLFISSQILSARWAKMEEASWKSKIQTEIEVREDGSSTEKSSLEYLILNERGKAKGTSTLVYNSNHEKLTLLNAETKNSSEFFVVDQNKIEDKTLASTSLQGFDSYNQVTINFPKVQIGSELKLKYEKEVKEAPIKNFWSLKIDYWLREPLMKGSYIKIKAKLPLFHELKSFQTKLSKQVEIKYSENKENKEFNLEITALEDIYYQVLEEEAAYFKESLPYLLISTSKSYEKMLLQHAREYEKIISKDLPQTLDEIADKALRENSLHTQVEIAILELIKTIRYQGDWRTVKGQLIPRELKETMSSNYGDCKDYSACLCAVLRKLGYKAYPAWVYRNFNYHPNFDKLPGLHLFNHAIVYLEHQEKTYFFDATNSMAYAKSPLIDIAGRKALILDPKKPFIKEIPEVSPENSTYTQNKEITFKSDNTASIKSKTLFHGVQAFLIAQFGLFSRSAEQVKNYMIKIINDNIEAKQCFLFTISQNFQTPQVISKDISVHFEGIIPETTKKTPFGDSYPVNNWLIYLTQLNTKKYELCGVSLGYMNKQKVKTIIKNKKLFSGARQEINIQINSSWLEYRRKVKQIGKDIFIEQELETKKNFISHKELHSKEFKEFQLELQDKAKELSLIFVGEDSQAAS